MKPQRRKGHTEKIWLALVVGNSRLHWAWFMGQELGCAWDTEYLPLSVVQNLANCQTLDMPVEMSPPTPLPQLPNSSAPLPLFLASVVPRQTALWQTYPDLHVITLDQIPLPGMYPTLGIDRALALWGAGEIWGWPMLVIDAGTALTLTGADANRCLVGGAILPGLGLQLNSLAQGTAGLTAVNLPENLPPRWALSTPEAIQSGVIYTVLAGIQDFIRMWRCQFPHSYITLTGGDRTLFLKYLQSQFPDLATGVIPDRNLIFWGMRCQQQQGSRED